MERINAWTTYSEDDVKKVTELGERYKAYLDRNWEIPEEFLEYDEDGKLILDPSSL